jgi:ADP-heptose:LPS heptosyltransferase
MQKYFVTLWGGLGDFLKMYYGHAQWRKLESLKKKYPNTHVKAVVFSLNKNAKSLVEYHPAVDEVLQPEGKLIEVRTKGLGAYSGNHKWLQKQQHILKTLNPTRPKIYLSEQDKHLVSKIVAETQGRFIIIHPFSAMLPNLPTSRTTMSVDKYIPIIEGLGEKGYKSIILGSDRPKAPEKFDYESEHVINLVDQTSVRSALKLVSRANGFIGTNSCFMCGAMLEKKPCFVVTSYFWENRVNRNGFLVKGLKDSRSKFTFIPQNRNKANYKRIQQEAINWFK